MILTIDGAPPVPHAKKAQIRRGLASLKGYRRPSFAILGRPDGDYVQVGNGGQTCVLEYHDRKSLQNYRVHLEKPHPVFSDGTTIQFANMQLAADEIISIQIATEVFCEFLETGERPSSVGWREYDLDQGAPL